MKLDFIDGTTVSEVHSDLTIALSKLPPRQQAVIALRMEGYIQESVADILGISRTTVWTDTTEALTFLGDKLKEYNENPGAGIEGSDEEGSDA